MEEIAIFLEQKSINAAEFCDQKLICKLAFLGDVAFVTSHLNKLYLQLQGKQQLIHKMCSYVRAFTIKTMTVERSIQMWKLCLLSYITTEQAYEQHFICFCDSTFKNRNFVQLW